MKAGVDGVVYLADSPVNAAKFLVIRGYNINELVVFEIDVDKLDESKLDISYDHNRRFFGCDAYVYCGNISTEAFECNEVYFIGIKED